jgi:hypothetical protein
MIRYSIDLTKFVEVETEEPVNFTRKKEHEALKEAINESGGIEKSGTDNF